MLLEILGLVLALLVLFVLVVVFVYRRSLPQTNGTLRVAGLQAPVEVLRDAWGVPHLYAANRDDLFFAQGYVHAQDRLWQMELNRRVGYGRLAEIFGALALDSDRLIRTLGFARSAQRDWDALDADTRHALECYARGVNAFLAQNGSRLPPEFLLLGFKPEPWRALDAVVFAKFMGWGLSGNWDTEILRAAFIGKLGVERAMELETDYPRTNPTILPSAIFRNLADAMTAQFDAAKNLPMLGIRGGSNNWVVDGVKTHTGKPLLANDPHLALTLPGVWYENHLVAPDYAVTGVSFAGAPGVVIGHNREIAWGFTNAFPDVQDLYIEKANPANPREFEYRGKYEPATMVREEIRVKGRAELHVEEVVITRHGPILNRVIALDDKSAPLALRWVGNEPSGTVQAFLKINAASTWDEFTHAIRDWTVPSQNMVFADRVGNIGFYQPGKIPVRAQGLGLVPSPGWTGEFEWIGWIPHEELPHAFNPPQHFVATANNQVVGDDYPHWLTRDYSNGYRAARITTLLCEKEKLTPDDFARIQRDVYCAPAKTLTAHLLTLQPRDDPSTPLRARFETRALAELKTWDYHLTAESVAGGICKTVEHFALRRLLADKLGDTLTNHFCGMGFHPVVSPITFFYDRALVMLLRTLEQEQSVWYTDAATGKTRTRAEFLTLAFGDAIAALRQKYGDDLSRWSWGNLHQIHLDHALGAVKPLDKIFSRAPRPLGGDPSTVLQGAYLPGFPIHSAHFLPSWRQIIDLADWDNSRAVHLPGQSGHPASEHYTDMIVPWLRGEYHALAWSREKVDAQTKARLVLEP
ncbi:MAG: penicillin acylase family protein [Chloroflexi bacterium]|nr:penicillin acylase family protein [Chloroflexota bacterium]